MSWSTSELRVGLAPWNRFKPSSKIFYWPFQGSTSSMELLCFFSAFVLGLPLCASAYLCLVATCWERLTSWLSFVVYNCEFVTFPLVSWVRCDTWLYRFLIFAPFLTFLGLRLPIINGIVASRIYNNWDYILKHFRNAVPAKMLIYCQKLMFSLSSLHHDSKRTLKRCGLWLPWRRDNSETSHRVLIASIIQIVFEPMFNPESKRKENIQSWSCRPLTTFISSLWRH